MRRIVFIGNCQVQFLADLYQYFTDRRHLETVQYIAGYRILTEASRDAIATADLIIEQRLDMPPPANIGSVETKADRLFVPLMAGGFLWPFAGQPHPKNPSQGEDDNGPYGAEMSDSYLNRLILQNIPVEQALAQYLALDVNSVRKLDRVMELILDRQRARDEVCGFEIAGFVEANFRAERMFLTPYHPDLKLTLRFATQFFEKMEVSKPAIARLHERLRRTPFPKDELPIHPSVIAHFGLKYVDHQTHYRFRNEGNYTFEEFCARYLACEWNHDLFEGIQAVRRDPDFALSRLEAGLERTPRSGEGWFAYFKVLWSKGRLAEAETAIRKAIVLEPNNPFFLYELAQLLKGLERFDEASVLVERAIEIEPFDAYFHKLHSALAAQGNRLEVAVAAAVRAVELRPNDPHMQFTLGWAHYLAGASADAIVSFRRAADWAPKEVGFNLMLSRVLNEAGHSDEAAEALRAVLAIEPENAIAKDRLRNLTQASSSPSTIDSRPLGSVENQAAEARRLGQLADSHWNSGRAEQAKDAYEAAIKIDPTNSAYHAALSHVLTRLGQVDDAIFSINAAIKLWDKPASYHVHHGILLLKAGRLAAAEQAFTRVLQLDPNNIEIERRLQQVKASQEELLSRVNPEPASIDVRPAVSTEVGQFATPSESAARGPDRLADMVDIASLSTASGVAASRKATPWGRLREWWTVRSVLRELRAMQVRHSAAFSFMVDRKLLEARTAVELGNRAQAAKLWDEAMADHPAIAGRSRHAVTILLGLGKVEDADALVRDGLKRYPDDAVFIAGAAAIALRRGDGAEVVRMWEVMRKKFPDNLEGYRFGASALVDAGRLDEADDIAGKAAKMSPYEVAILHEYARIASLRSDWEAALVRWGKVLDRGHPAGLWGKAKALRCLRRYPEAEEILAEAPFRCPMEPEPAYEMARIAEDKGDWPEAARRWAEARRRFPLNKQGYIYSMQSLLTGGDVEAAEKVLNEARERFPDHRFLALPELNN